MSIKWTRLFGISWVIPFCFGLTVLVGLLIATSESEDPLLKPQASKAADAHDPDHGMTAESTYIQRPTMIASASASAQPSSDDAAQTSSPSKTHPRYLVYETVPGFFSQDDSDTDTTTFDYTASNFGLVGRDYDSDADFDPDRRYTQWQRFEAYVNDLNKNSNTDTSYKVLYLGRHGEGYHNVAEAFYGTELWDCYWSKQPGDQSTNWTDARLTPTGIAQIEHGKAFWKKALADSKMPSPEYYYVSPLMRCLATAEITFWGLQVPNDRPFEPEVKELLRETIGVHTCDKRSSKSDILTSYPYVNFERGFAENDPFWEPQLREPPKATEARLSELLDDIFQNEKRTWLSLTSHSGAIAAILAVLHHRPFQLPTGGAIPVLVKARWVEGAAPSTKIPPAIPPPTCSVMPTSSKPT